MSSKSIYVGTDVGASRTKVAILDADRNLKGWAVKKSGTDFAATARKCLELSLKKAGVRESDIVGSVSTGYGRKNVAFAAESKTEIGCHAKGCFLYFPFSTTIIDIGGQDNKIIKLDDSGLRTNFKMNRKCAAGTGAFLEEMAMRLDLSLGEMDGLARRSENMVKLGSFCTVFSATEVLENIRQGVKLPDIVKGVFFSMVKRVLDLVLASLLLVCTAPLLLAIALGVKLTSPGPVFFKQRRYGLDGEEIRIFKFRTMLVCEDGPDISQATRDDSRVTPFGKFLRRTSLDELPQLFNVLQGHMSMVGPRPHAVAHNEFYRQRLPRYMLRHKVRPGITGLAQVNGFRGETETMEKMEQRLAYDLEYLRRWSLWLDVKLILQTVWRTVSDKNAY